MNRRILTGCTAAVAIAMGGVMSAQTQTQTPGTSAKDQAARNTITVTGCLQSEQGATGTTGAAAASAASSFKLTNAKMGTGETGSATAGTSGTETAESRASASDTGKTYMLEGQSAELKKHMNHQVQITGSLASSSSPSSGGRETAGTAGTKSAASGSEAKLNVESVKMISANCSK